MSNRLASTRMQCLPPTVMPMLNWREWTLATTHVAMPLSLFCLFPTQSVDIHSSMDWLVHLWCYTIDECMIFGLHHIGCSHDARSAQAACSGVFGRTTVVLAWSGDWLNHESNHGPASFLPSSGFCKGTSNSWHNRADPILLWLRMLPWMIQSTVITGLTRMWCISIFDRLFDGQCFVL